MADKGAEGLSLPLALLSAITVPWTLLKLRRLLSKRPPLETAVWLALGLGESSQIVEKARRLEQSGGWLRWLKWSDALYVIVLAAWVGVVSEVFALTAASEAPFDPWTLLELDEGASAAEIKAAYRRRALELHPDK